jgi:hypothetical protein
VTRLAGYRKYLNKSWDVDGIVFQSKHEADRYKVLRALEVAGTITDLRLQVPLHCLVNGLLVCDYIADFCWLENGAQHVGDAKSDGTRTALYKLKKKLVRACLEIEIEEL